MGSFVTGGFTVLAALSITVGDHPGQSLGSEKVRDWYQRSKGGDKGAEEGDQYKSGSC